MSKRPLTPLLLLCSLSATAQNMSFDGGAMQVASGTEMVLSGPLTWQLGANADVVNDGHIDFGQQATLQETVGAPITGSGTETARTPNTSPLVALEPGGLGLTLTTPDAAGGMTVDRGHLRQSASNGVLGIARWFGVSTVSPTTEALSVTFRYDPTELLGIDPAVLSLFGAPLLSGTWLPLATTGIIGDATLTATDNTPWAFFTAFDLDAATSMPEAAASTSYRVWPTVFEDGFTVQATNTTIHRLQLLDASGRCVWEERPSPARSALRLSPSHLASGAYLLRVNGEETFRLMHP